MAGRERWMFGTLCLIWGSTWIAVKIGLEAVPPLFLAGSRFSVAGGLLAVFAVARHEWTFRRSDWQQIMVASLLTIALCYGLLFWGMTFIDSGTAAVLDLGLTPIALMGFALILGEEPVSRRRVGAIALGVVGLAILFGPEMTAAWAGDDGVAGQRLVGAVAVAASPIAYGLGSIVSRRMLRCHRVVLVAGITNLVGGLALILVSLLFEPGAVTALGGQWGWQAWTGWAFLVGCGSLVAFTVYMVLLRDLGPTRAGLYAFVSPVVAVALGAAIRNEAITIVSLAGMVTLLSAAWLALREQPKGSRRNEH